MDVETLSNLLERADKDREVVVELPRGWFGPGSAPACFPVTGAHIEGDELVVVTLGSAVDEGGE